MSWNTAAQRSHRLSLLADNVWKKLSLCPRPSTVSTPFRVWSSGKIIGNNPHFSSKRKPTEGRDDIIILFISSMMRSPDMILIRSRLREIASKVSSTILNPNCVAKRIARIIRKGSSLNVISGSSGVRMSPASRSAIPPNGSTNSPKHSLFRQMASALIVKSRRFWSSVKVPSSTIGLRESCE